MCAAIFSTVVSQFSYRLAMPAARCEKIGRCANAGQCEAQGRFIAPRAPIQPNRGGLVGIDSTAMLIALFGGAESLRPNRPERIARWATVPRFCRAIWAAPQRRGTATIRPGATINPRNAAPTHPNGTASFISRSIIFSSAIHSRRQSFAGAAYC
jgi:hypothetical protein